MSTVDQSGKSLVTQDNRLIEACYGITLNEKRLLVLGVSKINSMVFPDKKTPLNFTITVDEWMKAYPDCKQPYKDMRRASEDLMHKSVTFKPREGDIEKKNVLWCDAVEFYRGRASIKIQFGWTMSLYLQGMIDQFTTYDLLSISRLKSIHSIRLYELLQQFKSTGYRVMSLEDFRFSMGVIDNYPRWSNLDRFVIKKAVKELNEVTALNITYKPTRRGKKISGVEFSFTEDAQTQD